MNGPYNFNLRPSALPFAVSQLGQLANEYAVPRLSSVMCWLDEDMDYLCPCAWLCKSQGAWKEQIFGPNEQVSGHGQSDKEGFGPTVSCQLVQSHGDACAVERAADALHCRWIDAEPLGNDPYARPPRSRQSLTDSFLQRSGYRRPTKTLPLAPGPRKPGADAFLNHGALELGKYAHHLKHRLACRRRGVEPLLAQV